MVHKMMDQNFEFCYCVEFFEILKKSVALSLCVDLDHYGRAQTRSH